MCSRVLFLSVGRFCAGGYLTTWRHDLAERRGNKHVATTAAARKIVHLVYYGMRDGHIRCLDSQTG
jgi:hypothetical protein